MPEDKDNCAYKDVIKNMGSDVLEIKKDVKSLLRFKWQLMGGSAVAGVLIVFIISCLNLIKQNT